MSAGKSMLEETHILCPYCGEDIRVLIDCSVESQEYIKDCQACCRPIVFQVELDADGDPMVQVRHENE